MFKQIEYLYFDFIFVPKVLRVSFSWVTALHLFWNAIYFQDGLRKCKTYALSYVSFPTSYLFKIMRLQVLPIYFHWHRNCKRKIWKYRQKPSDLKETIFLSSNFRFMQKSYKLQEIIKLTTLFVKLFAVK